MGSKQSAAEYTSKRSAVASPDQPSIQVSLQEFVFTSLVDLLRYRGISAVREYEFSPRGDGGRTIV
jgi:hypothetical protein